MYTGWSLRRDLLIITPIWMARSNGILTALPSPQHGITSIVMGNDGLALAPVKSGDEHELVTSFVRFEAMPRHALEKGIPWGWRSYGDYLDSLEGRLGHQRRRVGGHIAVRHYVLGRNR